MSVSPVKQNNTWLFTTHLCDPVTGEKVHKTRRGFKTKQEAIDAEKEFRKNFMKMKVEGCQVTFQEMFLKYMTSRKQEVKPTTYKNWMNRMELHVIPKLGHLRICEFTPKVIEDWRQEMLLKNLSDSYCNDILNPLRQTLRYANDFYDANLNFIEKIHTFKRVHRVKEEMKIWTAEQYLQFESVIDDPLWKLFFNLLYNSGCRKGEVMGLQWRHVDFEMNIITIRQALSEKVDGSSYILQTPKSRSSIRKVTLPQNTMNLLQNMYEKHKEQAEFNERNWFVCGGERPITSSTIHRHKALYCQKAHLPEIRIHDFRHSHASLLINNGMDIVSVSHRLGHSSLSMTLDTYTHYMPRKEDAIINLLDRAHR